MSQNKTKAERNSIIDKMEKQKRFRPDTPDTPDTPKTGYEHFEPGTLEYAVFTEALREKFPREAAARDRFASGDHKNNPSDPQAGWFRRPGTITADDPGRAYHPLRFEDMEGYERSYYQKLRLAADLPPWPDSTQKAFTAYGSPDNGPFPDWHIHGMCYSPNRHEEPVAQKYWSLSSHGYWLALCTGCLIIDIVNAAENPDLRILMILPAVVK